MVPILPQNEQNYGNYAARYKTDKYYHHYEIEILSAILQKFGKLLLITHVLSLQLTRFLFSHGLNICVKIIT